MALIIGLAGCGLDGASLSPTARPSASDAPTTVPTPTAAPSAQPVASTASAASAAPTPHQGEIAVVEVVDAPSGTEDVHLVALRLQGAVGSSAIFRSVEIRARTEPIEDSACVTPPVTTVLRPTHADALQPALADQTRVAVVRSLGSPLITDADGSAARFRYGPVPSLNGDFEGWVTFHVSVEAGASDGFCAFDFSGVVTIVAGETTSRPLPTVRIDTRDAGD